MATTKRGPARPVARWRELLKWERALELPMAVLGLVWLVLLIVEYTRGMTPGLVAVGNAIYVIFVLDFTVRLILAPRKLHYLSRNWLTLISLLLPALRILRVVRAVRLLRTLRAVRGIRLVRLVSSLNRSMRALAASMGRRGLRYVVVVTVLVALGGAAGMFAFERDPATGVGLDSYGTALWWTVMVLTTMGSELWPRTPEGRVLCVLLACYAFSVFGYFTAALATHFVEREALEKRSSLPSQAALRELRDEVAALKSEIAALRQERNGA